MSVYPGNDFIGYTSLGPLNQKNYAIFHNASRNCDIMMMARKKIVFPTVPRKKGSRVPL